MRTHPQTDTVENNHLATLSLREKQIKQHHTISKEADTLEHEEKHKVYLQYFRKLS